VTSKNKSRLKALFPWIIVGLVLASIWGLLNTSDSKKSKTPATYSQVMEKIQGGLVKHITLQGDIATVVLTDNSLLQAQIPAKEQELIPSALKAGTVVQGLEVEAPSGLMSFFSSWGPTLLLLGVIIFMARQRDTGGKTAGSIFAVGKSKAKLLAAGESTVVFADVAGCDEAKQEVSELVEFLREPAKFEKLGGRIPRGVLLEGPPGTGKTLLARAIAGEAKVPFFTMSGSDFMEMLVGVGASRVRDLFKQAKAHAPCIIFIDEIDAIGRQRSGGGGAGSNGEQEQTLNQLLVEMDGFETGQGVIVLAATNRSDILDAALLRPGRFDRQVNVGLPDVKGREQILAVHMRKVPVAADISIETLAKGTPGFSGADLANLVNEAALIAAKSEKLHVGMPELEKAKDKLLMGSERHSMRMSEAEKSVTAYHEAGHTLVAKVFKNLDPIHKVSIIPRGRALGVTLQLPEADRYSLGKKRILDTIAMLFGGRVAEELFTDDVTTGASNDYERATQLAYSYVSQWGMSDRVGPVVISGSSVSEATRQAVDEEVRRILSEQYDRVTDLLRKHSDVMHALHNALMRDETLDAAQVQDILEKQVSEPLLSRV
jgi:cell division protease FtsH